jgi:LacI family transcriptional regulator
MPVPVTVVDHDPRELGREAAGLLLSRLGNGDRHQGPARLVEMPVRLAPAVG